MRSGRAIACAVLLLAGVAMGAALSASRVRKQQHAESQPQPNSSQHFPQQASPQNQKKKPSHLLITSGELLSASGTPIQVSHFDALVGGDQKPEQTGQKPVVTILHGGAFLTADALTKLLNGHLDDGNIKDLKVETAPNKLTINGKAKKGIEIPFRVEGPVEATPEGLLKLQVTSKQAAHLPGVAELFGFNPSKMVDGQSAAKGIQADKDSISFDPDLMWGLPIHGRVVKASVTAKGLFLTFREQGATRNPPPAGAP